MKIFITFLFLTLISSCASYKRTTLAFSPVFKLNISAKQLSGSTIFYSDELSLKTENKILISAMIISSETEKLPVNFDIRSYPKYLLELEKTGQDSLLTKEFTNTIEYMKKLYDFQKVQVIDKGGVTFYTVCGLDSCIGYVVKDSFSEHIFSVRASIKDQKSFTKFLLGATDVK